MEEAMWVKSIPLPLVHRALVGVCIPSPGTTIGRKGTKEEMKYLDSIRFDQKCHTVE